METIKFNRTDGCNIGKNLMLVKPVYKEYTLDNFIIACIGTDRSTGDSLGPLVGYKLSKLGYKNVIGTLSDPLHAMNLVERIKTFDTNKKVLAIDACLGDHSNIGYFHISKGPIKPGAGVNKILPPVGDFSISGVVNVSGFMEFMVLQNTRLSLIMKMADEIVAGIKYAFPIKRYGYE
jgi:putative sporulation protein YyaC